MTKPTPESGNSIDRLLRDRAQFVSWLTRLNSSAEQTANIPEAVRGRVRADYERRLAGVLEELRSHTNALEEQVDSLAGRAAELTTRESEHKERLAEAEVRHQVGEYDDVKWEGIRAELLKVIGHIREELGQTMLEVGRLNEVLGTIRAPVPPAPTTASAPRPAITTSGQRAAVTAQEHPEAARHAPAAQPPAAPQPPAEIPLRTTAPRPQPKPAPPPSAAKKDEGAGRTLWFPSGKPEPAGGKLDELAFLKSVTGNETPAAPPPTQRTRQSGGFRSVEVPAPAPPPPAPPPAPPAQTPPPQASAPLVLPDPLPGPKAPPVEKEPRGGSGQKTLKCGECGTLNRPTEWYCERCGAELAAL
jgi:hypothetical protein